MEKKCCACRKEFPKTTEYFFTRKIKQFNAKGELKIYDSFRSDCNKCRANKADIRRVKKRCKEMGCDVSEYREKWKEQYSKTRIKNPDLRNEGLNYQVANNISEWQKEGYVFTTYEQYRLDIRKKYSKSKRKYDYGDVDFIPKDKANRRGIINITDAYIALMLGYPVSEVPKDIIETKRLIIKLKRELKTTSYGK